MKMLLALFLMLALGTAAGAEKQKAVPAHFVGLWNANLKHCGYGARAESGLTISTSHIEFYASAGPIHEVATQGGLDLLIVAELFGEGEARLTRLHFRLSADHKSLTNVTDGAKDVRFKCP